MFVSFVKMSATRHGHHHLLDLAIRRLLKTVSLIVDFRRRSPMRLIAGHPEDFWLREPPPIPIKIQVESLEKGRGAPPDPKRAINKDLIGKRVAREKQGRGEYDFAVRRVWEALERDKKAENWQGDLPSERTIRPGYDRRLSDCGGRCLISTELLAVSSC